MIKKVIKKIMEHATEVAENIDQDEVEKIIEELKELRYKPRSIFILGSGRSKLVGEAFAMRLAQLELDAHVIGDSTTISPKKDDLIIVISSSGDTKSIISEVKRLKGKGAKIIGITANTESKLQKLSNFKIYVEKPKNYRDYKKEIERGNEDNETPLGTLYEDTTLLILDGLVAKLMKKLGKTEKDLAEVHY